MPALKKGEVVLVDRIPECDFCSMNDIVEPGPYDFVTIGGFSWASGCLQHYVMYRAYESLGVGKGQLWITEDQVELPIQMDVTEL